MEKRIDSGRSIVFVWMGVLALLSSCGGGGDGEAGASTDAPFKSGTGFGGTNPIVNTISLATDGSGDVYAGGRFSDYNGTARANMARIDRDGSLDLGFSTGSGFNDIINVVAPATDGSGDVYVGGDYTDYNGTARVRIARLNSDGTLDTAFDPGLGTNAAIRAIAVTTDGSGDIYIAGDFNNYNGTFTGVNYIARINSDGSLDSGFATGSGFDQNVHAVALANDGSGDLYASGSFTTYRGNARSRMARINSDGSNDANFDPGTGFSGIVSAIAVATDGSGDIYAGGFFAKFNGVDSKGIARVNSDGSLDGGFFAGTGFYVGGVTAIDFSRDGSGSIYAVGNFSHYRGNSRGGVVRINNDGSNDAGFDPGTGSYSITDIALATDGSDNVYLVGPFKTYNAVAAKNIIRVNLTGTPN